jgi:hypothetical protein
LIKETKQKPGGFGLPFMEITMIHLTSIGLILDEETMTFYLAGENGEPSFKGEYDYRTATDVEDISKEDMNIINYYGELHEAREEMEEAIEEAKKQYHKSVSIITNYYRSFGGLK